MLHYLVAAADTDRVPAGGYDICGPDTTSYRRLLEAYAGMCGRWHAAVPVGNGLDTATASRITAAALPIPQGLAADLVESLDHPMRASASGLRDQVPDPPGGLLGIEDAIALALADAPHAPPAPVNALADRHCLADSDPSWAQCRPRPACRGAAN